MKCVFAVTDRDPCYLQMAKVLVATARLNSKIDLYCLYDGQQGKFTSWLSTWDIPCIKWQVPFLGKIRERYTGKKSIGYCAGAYLCIEVSQAFRAHGIDDTHVLFIDADTMILHDPQLDHKQPACFAAPPDWDISDWNFISTGVMVLNLDRMRQDYSRFVEHLLQHNFDFAFAGHGPCSQGAWNTFYRGEWEKLDPECDWKPWWGFNPNAKIVHFSGPKPHEVAHFLANKVDETQETERRKIHRFVIQQDVDSYKRYLQIWNSYNTLITERKSDIPNGMDLVSETPDRRGGRYEK